ncbi:MAG: AAA family ATPase [Desulfurellaceae bacterium]|nr:AAA family ATPase [Desulfurellaceae bacterium]
MSASFQRVAVIGATGCGKTTLAREVARRISAPHVELDALRYRQGWVVVLDEAFRSKVAAHVGTDRWVIDGNYANVQDLTWLRAQLLVWIDFPLPLALWRLMRRTLGRLLTGEVLANGNREQLRRVFSRQSILIWAVRSHSRRRQLYEELLTHPRYAHMRIVRLRSPSAIRTWLAGIPEPVWGSQAESKIEGRRGPETG